MSFFSAHRTRAFRATPAAIAIATLFAPALAGAQTLEGFTNGFTYPYMPVEGAPLLRSFYLRYSDEDHHISSVSIDPHQPQLGTATVAFADHNNDDRYYYRAEFTPYYGDIWRRTLPREFCRGTCVVPIEHPGDIDNWAFVITGFFIYYRGGDHHIDEIRVSEDRGTLTVAFNDDNDDDPFAFDLQYAYIPRSRLSDIGVRSGTTQTAQGTEYPVGTAVLRGFHFNYASGDHHIKELGVMLRDNGTLEAYYGDKEPDDTFSWSVEYGILAPRRRPPFQWPPILDPPILQR